MKKISLVIIGLLITAQAWANTISIQPFVSSSDVTLAHLESQRTTLVNVINGGISGNGVNIQAGSINTPDLANTVSPIVRWDEAFNDFTVSGMLGVTSGSLTSNISSGVSYVDGYRVALGTTAHTYTASKDTYVYIHSGGYYVFQEVVNGAAAPSTPANTLLLFIAVTNGTTISSITDSRTLSIQITANSSNFSQDYRNQSLVVRDSTTAVHAEPGQFSIGSVFYSNTVDTSSLSTATAGNWIEGNVPNLSNLKFYVYGYNSAGTAFALKYSSADPVYSDTSQNTNGTLRYYNASSINYRALAWVSGDSTGTIQTSAFSNYLDVAIQNKVSVSTGTFVSLGTTAIPLDNTTPLITEGNAINSLTVVFRPNNINDTVRVRAVVNLAASGNSYSTLAMFKDYATNAVAAVVNGATNADYAVPNIIEYEFKPSNTNLITFTFRAGNNGGNAEYLNASATSTAGLFNGTMLSKVEVMEIAS